MASTDVRTRDGGLVVELTKAAFTALEREARAQMDAAIGDLGLGKGEADRERGQLNACADVLSAVQRAQTGWTLEDPREEADLKAVEFSSAAVAFLRAQRESVARHVCELDNSSEGEYDYIAREVYALHVLDRVLTEGVAA